MFQDVYARIENGSNAWQCLQAPDGQLYPWDESSTYIKNPPFFKGMTKVLTLQFINLLQIEKCNIYSTCIDIAWC